MQANFAPRVHPFPLPLVALNAGHQKLPRREYEPNCWPFYQFVCCYQGQGVYKVEGQTFKLVPGTVIFMKPDVRHRYAVEQDWCSLSWVSFEGPLIASMSADSGMAGEASYAIVRDRSHPGIQQELMSIFEQVDDPFALHRVSAVLYRIAVEFMLQLHTQGDPERDTDKRDHIVEAAVARMKRRMQTPPDIASLADELHITRQHLCRLFRHKFGVTTKEYWTRLKIVQSQKDLVEYPDRPVKTIADNLGFVNTSHFTKVFRQTTGATPNAFRATNLFAR